MSRGVVIKDATEIEGMRKSCALAAEALSFLDPYVVEGITTLELDEIAHDFILSRSAYPSPLRYHGFPKSICTSINEVICHGIPEKRKLKAGDIINIDVTVYLNGFHGDTSKMFCIGEVSEEARRLVETTRECLDRAIEVVSPRSRLGDIGYAVQSLAEARGFSVVREFCGHGVGRSFHEDPHVVHYGSPGQGMKLREGMIFTIEPMLNAGKPDVKILDDEWTAVTVDGSLSAQFEHTILVTARGHEVLTRL